MSVLDPRLAGVRLRLAEVERIVAVSGGKGGIGKSVVASTLALALAERGLATGLFDLDLTGPCDHLILGLGERQPSEEFGLDPPRVHGVRFLSVSYFAGERPAPLRGEELSDALIELLAVGHWGPTDVLVIDMPPGLGDASLDLVRLLRAAEYLVLANPSRVVLETVRRTLTFHRELGSRVAGVVENMSRGAPAASRSLAEEFGVPFLGSVPFDAELEGALGDARRLLATRAGAAIRALAATLAA